MEPARRRREEACRGCEADVRSNGRGALSCFSALLLELPR
jgi:hypothetical protein